MSDTPTAPYLSKVPKELESYLGVPALIGTEHLEDYLRFRDAIVENINPGDTLEWIYVEDVAYVNWQIVRERRVEANYIKLQQKEIVRELIISASPDPLEAYNIAPSGLPRSQEEANQWAGDDPIARQKIVKKLKKMGVDESELVARAYQRGANLINQFHRRLESYEIQRSRLLKDLAFFRASFSSRLQRLSSEVIDAEFTEALE